MLHKFPDVQRWEQTDDVLQNALIRLDRSLRTVQPETILDFFRLSASQIRRELLDLVRRFRGPHGLKQTYATPPVGHPDNLHPALATVSESTWDPSRLSDWTEFHQLVKTLPPQDLEVFDLLWYQGLPRPEVAKLLNISERTVHRRWVSARIRLDEAMKNDRD